MKIFYRIMMTTALLTAFVVAKASEVVEVLPLTDQILMVHFNDGYIQHHKNGQARSLSNEKVFRVELNTTNAVLTTSYTLASTTDANYLSAKNPTSVGRKSKGVDFPFATTWDAGMTPTSTNKAVYDHWLWLHLPTKLQSGASYTLTTGSLAGNGNSFNFTFDEKTIRSEAVKVNQLGYLPNAPYKYGYVYQWTGESTRLDLSGYAGKSFWIVDAATDAVVHSGTLAFRKAYNNVETPATGETPYQNYLNADVYECDFSSFNTPGHYRLAVEGIGCSYPFEINVDVYAGSAKSIARSLYHNRSGIALTSEFTDFTRGAPHNPNLTSGFSSRLKYTTVRACDFTSENHTQSAIEAGYKGLINTWGWYQDAGDWDGYSSHGRIPALLLLAYELTPEKYTDGQWDIPQSFSATGTVNSGKTNSIPDILDEARWLIMYYWRTRHAIMDAGYGTGGVGGARTYGDLWGDDIPGNARGSWQDNTRDWYVSGEDPFTTYWYAGLAAHYAYLLQ